MLTGLACIIIESSSNAPFHKTSTNGTDFKNQQGNKKKKKF